MLLESLIAFLVELFQAAYSPMCVTFRLDMVNSSVYSVFTNLSPSPAPTSTSPFLTLSDLLSGLAEDHPSCDELTVSIQQRWGISQVEDHCSS